MGAFTLGLKATVDNLTGKEVTFVTTNNYSSNDEGYTEETFVTKQLALFDCFDAPLDVINIVDNEANFTLTKDLFLVVKMILTKANNTTLEKTFKFPFRRITDIAIADKMSAIDCSACHPNVLTNLRFAVNAIESAQIKGELGSGIEYQKLMDTAVKFIK